MPTSAKKPILTSLIDLFTLMANTPVVELESTTRPNVIPLKTFSTTFGPSSDFISRESLCVGLQIYFFENVVDFCRRLLLLWDIVGILVCLHLTHHHDYRHFSVSLLGYQSNAKLTKMQRHSLFLVAGQSFTNNILIFNLYSIHLYLLCSLLKVNADRYYTSALSLPRIVYPPANFLCHIHDSRDARPLSFLVKCPKSVSTAPCRVHFQPE